jgi:maleylpyruvate isomerase
VLWLRAREVWIHRADLTSGATFDDFPADFLEALIDDVRSALRVPVDDLRVTGSPAAVAAWLTGRSAGGGLSSSQPLPDLPSWL